MKTNFLFRSLVALTLILSVILTGFGQTPKKMYSEVYYHKLKPGHTFAEARAIENEFKKIHQVQADEGSIVGWYMLALDMTSNPNKEYSYITIKNFSDLGYMDNAYPEAVLKKVMGTDYQTKLNDLSKRMSEVKEVTKAEIWENLDVLTANPMPAPNKAPVWIVSYAKVKNGQHEEYTNQLKKLKPYVQERLNIGDGAAWSFASLTFPWSSEKGYDYAWVIQLPTMKAVLDDSRAEPSFKKTMPGVDQKQFCKELDKLGDLTRQELYYLLEYAVKAPSAQATK